jgi:hypothetical protein
MQTMSHRHQPTSIKTLEIFNGETRPTDWLATSQRWEYTYRPQMMEQTPALWETDGKYWTPQIPKDTPISSGMTKTPQGKEI